jgi:hypothetical protein
MGNRQRAAMGSANRLKLGLFAANCSSGRAVTTVLERWSGSWPDCVRLAQLADEAGIEFMLPIGRWKGYGGDTDYQGSTWETVTWACGLLAKTRRLTVFGTVHAPLIPPLIAAKEFVTADHIGEGRFGLNVVCGWNEGEFEMFGATLHDHEARYEYADDQGVVPDGPWRRDLAPLVIECNAEMHFLGGAIELDHLAQTIAEPVPMRLGEVVQLILAGIHAARRHLVQQRLPNMCPGTLHQGNAGSPAPAETITEPGHELQPGRAAAHHDNPMQPVGLVRAGNHHLGASIGNHYVVLDLTIQPLHHRIYSG